MPAGRPSTYSQDVATRICEKLAGGKSLRSICLADDMPDMSTIYDWIRKHPEFAKQYAQANEDRADALFEEMFSIADDGTNDTYTTDDGRTLTDHDVIHRSKLRIDTRKWALARMNARKYGDRQEVTHTGGVSITISKDDAAL